MELNFLKRFDVPDAALPVIDSIVTPFEQRVSDRLPAVFGVEAVREALAGESGGEVSPEDAKDFAERAYRRGIFSIEREAGPLYRLGDFYGLLDLFAVGEPETYRSFPEKTREALDKWCFDAYLSGLDPARDRPTEDAVVPLDELIDGIDRDSRQLYLAPCDCRCLHGGCSLPVLTCLSYRQGVNTYAHRGVGKPITKEEGKQVAREADRAGLVHTRNPGGICNCCDDCCYLFRARRARDSGSLWPRADHVISVERALCVSCGTCVKRCRFGALRLENGALAADGEKCVGCGLCVSACPTGALRLAERTERT